MKLNRCGRIDRKRMDAVIHQIVNLLIDHPVPLERQVAGKRVADNSHMEVAFAFASMTGVLVPLIADLEQLRCKGALEALADLIDDRTLRITHGSTLRNGLTDVSRYTPAST